MKKINIFIIFILSLTLTGCMKSLSFTSYLFPDSIGIEYKEGKYQVSTLITNPLANVNFETSSTLFPNLLLITATGDSINEAFQKLRVGEQESLSPVHLKSIVLNKSIFEETSTTYEDILKTLIQNPNHNLKIWIYITEEDIQEVYSVKSFMNSSPYFSALNFPSYKEMSNLCYPVNLITSANEYFSGRVTYLPMVSIEKNSIKQENVEEDTLEEKRTYSFKEMCFISKKETFTCLKENQLLGYKWLQGIDDIDYNLDRLSFGVKKNKISRKYKNDKMLISLKLSIYIYDNIDSLSKEEIVLGVENKIKEELELLGKVSYEHQIDFFNVKDYYKRHKNRTIELKEDTLHFEVEVDIMTQSIFDY